MLIYLLLGRSPRSSHQVGFPGVKPGGLLKDNHLWVRFAMMTQAFVIPSGFSGDSRSLATPVVRPTGWLGINRHMFRRAQVIVGISHWSG